jgi:hypothetical protein
MINSISHSHGGTQEMIVKDNNGGDALTIRLDLAGCMIHFRHRMPTIETTLTLKQYCLRQGGVPWNTSLFSLQVTDKFYQQVIDIENYKPSYTNLQGAKYYSG